jgi:glutamate-ammonia-ligase adenylyltransferase
LAAAREAIFHRPLPPDWAQEIKRLRAKMDRERSAPSGLDLKMGPGGLVEVEFAAQALQLLHGRDDEALRSPHILKGLTALFKAGHLDRETYQALFDGYRHLRQLDRRLRLIHDRGGDRKGYQPEDLKAAGIDPAQTEQIRGRIELAYARVMATL